MSMHTLEKISRFLNQAAFLIAGVFLIALIALICSNIFLRSVWAPIKGTFELMGFFGAILTAFALGFSHMQRAHISVDILVNRFPKAVQRVLNAVNHFICMIFFSIAGWQIAAWGRTIWKTGEVTETLRIIYYPFVFAVALGCFLLALTMLVDFLNMFIGERR
jgi:TRAP-type C4-dicarboxylate transport system permease small subunit